MTSTPLDDLIDQIREDPTLLARVRTDIPYTYLGVVVNRSNGWVTLDTLHGSVVVAVDSIRAVEAVQRAESPEFDR